MFIHFRDDNRRAKAEPVLQIPPSIYERMVTNSFVLSSQLVGSLQSARPVIGTTVKNNGKYFIGFQEERIETSTPRYYIGFSQMKDI